MDTEVQYIDLSLPIQNHWRWRFHKTIERDYTMNDPLREEYIYMPVHCFTHIDPPSHAFASENTIDQIPLNNLIGPAHIIDVSDKEENHEITPKDLNLSSRDIQPGEMVIIKTLQDQRYSIAEQEFWTTSPFLSQSAADSLVEKKVKAVAFDFPQDYVLRDFFRGIIPSIEAMHVHKTLLGANILQIEYITNLSSVPFDKVILYAIPLNLAGVAGSPARVFTYTPPPF